MNLNSTELIAMLLKEFVFCCCLYIPPPPHSDPAHLSRTWSFWKCPCAWFSEWLSRVPSLCFLVFIFPNQRVLKGILMSWSHPDAKHTGTCWTTNCWGGHPGLVGLGEICSIGKPPRRCTGWGWSVETNLQVAAALWPKDLCCSQVLNTSVLEMGLLPQDFSGPGHATCCRDGAVHRIYHHRGDLQGNCLGITIAFWVDCLEKLWWWRNEGTLEGNRKSIAQQAGRRGWLG